MNVPVLVQLVLAATCLLRGSPSALAAAGLLVLVVGLQLAVHHDPGRPARTSRVPPVPPPS